MANCIEIGKDIRDIDLAEKLFRQGAMAGYSEAQFNLANLILRKPRTEANIEQVRPLLTAALRAGYAGAARPLQALSPPPEGLPRSLEAQAVGGAEGQKVWTLASVDGRWSTGDCRTKYYDYSIHGNEVHFRDQVGALDIERVTDVRNNGFSTVTVSSSSSSLIGIGTRWNYTFDGGQVRIEDLTNHRHFAQTRCAPSIQSASATAPSSVLSPAPAPDSINQPSFGPSKLAPKLELIAATVSAKPAPTSASTSRTGSLQSSLPEHCPAGVPPPLLLAASRPNSSIPAKSRVPPACVTVSELAARFTSLQNAAVPAKNVLEQQTDILRKLKIKASSKNL